MIIILRHYLHFINNYFYQLFLPGEFWKILYYIFVCIRECGSHYSSYHTKSSVKSRLVLVHIKHDFKIDPMISLYSTNVTSLGSSLTVNPLSVNLPTNCLSEFDHFVGLALKGLINLGSWPFLTFRRM